MERVYNRIFTKYIRIFVSGVWKHTSNAQTGKNDNHHIKII